MPGRFRLLTDENITGPLIEALIKSGWDVARTIEVYGERSDDERVLVYAVEHDRVLVSTDEDHLIIGRRWLDQGRGFRLVFWQQGRHQHVRPADFLRAFDALAAKDNVFASCIEYLRI